MAERCGSAFRFTKFMKLIKLINTIWKTDSSCANGLNAMLLAYKCYQNNDIVNTTLPIMKEMGGRNNYI